MTRGSFSTTICHNGGDGFRQREQGYHIPSVGRRYEDSLFSWAGDGCVSSAIYVVSRSTTITSVCFLSQGVFGVGYRENIVVNKAEF